MKRASLFVIMLILIVGMSAFAGGRRDARDGQIRVAVAMSPMNNPFHVNLFRFIQEAIAEAPPNFHFTIYHAETNDVQVNVMELIYAGRYDGVLISTQDGNLMAEPSARLHRQGARTVVINRALDTDEWDAYVTGDNVGSGTAAAKHMGRVLNGRGNVFIVGMTLGTPIAEERSRGFLEVMRTEFPNINILGTAEGGNNVELGFNAMQNILAAHPHIDAIYTHDPFSAQGQEQAIINAGRRDVRMILASGVDFTSIRYFEQNPNTIFKGGGLYPPSMSGDGIRTLIRILQGETPCTHRAAGCGCPLPRIQFIDAGLLLFENLDQWRHLVPPGWDCG